MEVIYGLENVKREPTSAVSVGSFDGIHLGHQRILKRMRATESIVTILSFDPHPQRVLQSRVSTPQLLTAFDERSELFERLGVDRLIIVKFNSEFAQLAPEEFVEQILVKIVGMSYIFVGPTHGFGRDRKGDVELLRKLGEKRNFKVEVVDGVMRFSQNVSSSRIRRSLTAGDVLTAWRCLGRPFYIGGKVVHGDSRGRKLGIPTANLDLNQPGKIMPPPGIYSTVTEIDGVRWPSVSHLGDRPTFKGAKPAIETHVIGFNENLYGKRINIGLVDRLREVMAFNSPQELVRQMVIDRASAKRRLAELGFSTDARMRIQRYGKIIL